MLSLVNPDLKYKDQYIEMLQYWNTTGEEPMPWVLREDHSDFEAMIKRFEGFPKGIGIDEEYVPHSTYWLYESDSDKIIGAVNIRHCLNDKLLEAWGSIGYGIRPDERKKGYATLALRLTLGKCRELGMKKALLGCYKENTSSAKVIEKNGGVLENEVEVEGRVIKRYWIKI